MSSSSLTGRKGEIYFRKQPREKLSIAMGEILSARVPF
jgi:hypothetical protein